MAATALVQTRIDPTVRDKAAEALDRMGMTVSDAVHILLTRVAKEGALPAGLMVDPAAHDAGFRAKVMKPLKLRSPLFRKRRSSGTSPPSVPQPSRRLPSFVSHESGNDLAAAHQAGFRTIGHLRVWGRPGGKLQVRKPPPAAAARSPSPSLCSTRSALPPKPSVGYKPCMPSVSLAPVRRVDAAELARLNIESRAHHEPWVQPFTTLDGFEEWFGTLFTGANVGFVARDLASGGVVGVTNLSQIVLKGFQSAYLSYTAWRPLRAAAS